jgi:hypothetical protein
LAASSAPSQEKKPMMADGDMTELAWHTSTYSDGHDCVEAARMVTEVLVRDSTRVPRPVLAFTTAAWDGFLAAIAAGATVPGTH